MYEKTPKSIYSEIFLCYFMEEEVFINIDKRDIPVVILCGGKGTRLREETETIPKPLVPIGGKPILWHIMKIYSHYGFNKFILLLGYKGDMIKSFFLKYPWITNDFNIKTKEGKISKINENNLEDWDITFLDTGLDSLTSKRLNSARNILKNYKYFMLTYGDGVADVNLNELLRFHTLRDKILTITGSKVHAKQGKIAHKEGVIHDFSEKPILDDLINGGFMIFNNEVFSYLSDRNVMLEYDLIPRLVSQRKVGIFEHQGFWHSMDTFQDKESLEKLWENNPPWRIWTE